MRRYGPSGAAWRTICGCQRTVLQGRSACRQGQDRGACAGDGKPVQGYLGPILRWADAEDLIPHDFGRAVIRVGAEVKRDRVLSHDELQAVWHASLAFQDSVPVRNFGRHGPLPDGHRPARRRGRYHAPWRLARRNLEADRREQQAGPRTPAEIAGNWRSTRSTAARRRTWSFPARPEQRSAPCRS